MAEKDKNEKCESLEEVYQKLKDKFNLPDFDSLTNEFEILEVDSEKLALRNIRRKMVEKFEFYAKVLHDLLQPEMLYSNEARIISEAKPNVAGKIFRLLIKLERESVKLDLVNDDLQDASFINDSFKFWLDIKLELIELCDIAIKSWDVEEDDSFNAGYLG